jgi:hypothetical protein
MDQTELDKKLEKLANEAADRLLQNGVVDEGFLDAFKVLSGYQSSSRKLSKVASGGEDNEGGGFGAAKRRIAEASNGVTPSGNPN